jgi:hypothetical protein
MIAKALARIDAKRAALKLPLYEPSRFGSSGDRRLRQLMELPAEDQEEAIYGRPSADP